MINHRSLAKRAIIAALAGVATVAGQLAGAATANPDTLEEVVITGSRIAIPGTDSVSPVQTVSSEDIANSGVANIQDLLLKNPTFGTPTLSRTNSNFLTSGAGVSTIDLRNLGISRTLVLVDGRRFVAGVPGDSAVDLNDIPAQFIDRVDVLTGGASAVYGSDAVAGVVNFIYKKHFEGVSYDAQYGESSLSDDKESQVGITLGTNFADGRGNVMTHIGYTNQGAVYSKDRPRSAVDQASVGAFFTGAAEDMFTIQRPFYSSFAPQGRFFYVDTSTGTPVNHNFTYDANGNVIPWSTNGPNGDGVGATGFNRSAFRTIAVPTERYLLATRGNFEFTDNHSAFLESTYASAQTTSKLEPFPLSSAQISPGTGGLIPAEFMVNGVLTRNPLVPDQIYNNASDQDGDGLRDYSFTRRLSEVGNRGQTADRDMFRIVAGFEGTVFNNWKYEAFYSYGQSKESQVSGGQVNVQNFLNALMAVPDVNDVNGNGNTTEPICVDANARAEGCVPANVFGFNSLSAAALNYITAPGMLATVTTQKVAGASISGEAFSLPAGPVGVAAGVEHRSEYARSEIDSLTQLGLNAGNAIPRTEGKFDVNEVYAETSLPILAKLPAIEALTLRGAARFSDYPTVGNATTWNAGLEWKISPSLRFRAIRAISTRAPNIAELYQPPSQTFPTGLQDPCDGVTATSTGTYDAACRADPGVAANIAANGSFTLTQPDQQGISGYDRGNPNLGAEKGKSWTLGFVFTPEGALHDLGVTIDYFKIDIDKAIVSTPRQFILGQCYSGNVSFCQFIKRRPVAVGAYSAGSIDTIDSASTNSGGQGTSGIDLTVNYAHKLGPGRFRTRLSYTHEITGFIVPLPGADKDQTAGEVG